MKSIKIKDYLGNEIEGNWNEKFYSSKMENTKRICVNNKEVIIKNEDIEKISTTETAGKNVINNYFSKLNMEERAEVLTYLSTNLQKEYKKETNLYVNEFEKNSNKYLLVEEFKKLDFETKVQSFTRMKDDYKHQKSLEESGNWHN